MRTWPAALLLLLASSLPACSSGYQTNPNSAGDGGVTATPTPTPTGSVVVNITDDPFSDAQAVLVTFDQVLARDASGGFALVPFVSGSPARTCDMKHLYRGRRDVLAQGSLPAGHYTGLRFGIASGRLFFDDPTVQPACAAAIDPPRGKNAALVVSTPETTVNVSFDVKAGATTTITADLAGPQSVKRSGSSYLLQPVIRIDAVDGP